MPLLLASFKGLRGGELKGVVDERAARIRSVAEKTGAGDVERRGARSGRVDHDRLEFRACEAGQARDAQGRRKSTRPAKLPAEREREEPAAFRSVFRRHRDCG